MPTHDTTHENQTRQGRIFHRKAYDKIEPEDVCLQTRDTIPYGIGNNFQVLQEGDLLIHGQHGNAYEYDIAGGLRGAGGTVLMSRCGTTKEYAQRLAQESNIPDIEGKGIGVVHLENGAKLAAGGDTLEYSTTYFSLDDYQNNNKRLQERFVTTYADGSQEPVKNLAIAQPNGETLYLMASPDQTQLYVGPNPHHFRKLPAHEIPKAQTYDRNPTIEQLENSPQVYESNPILEEYLEDEVAPYIASIIDNHNEGNITRNMAYAYVCDRVNACGLDSSLPQVADFIDREFDHGQQRYHQKKEDFFKGFLVEQRQAMERGESLNIKVFLEMNAMTKAIGLPKDERLDRLALEALGNRYYDQLFYGESAAQELENIDRFEQAIDQLEVSLKNNTLSTDELAPVLEDLAEDHDLPIEVAEDILYTQKPALFRKYEASLQEPSPKAMQDSVSQGQTSFFQENTTQAQGTFQLKDFMQAQNKDQKPEGTSHIFRPQAPSQSQGQRAKMRR